MTQFQGWDGVTQLIDELAQSPTDRLNEGQCAALSGVARRLRGEFGNECRGIVIADEVGMGKTRVASAVARKVVELGGRVAILIPAGLRAQWQKELRGDGMRPELVRSLDGYLQQFRKGSWAKQPVVLLSHQACNWRLGGDSPKWRWGLLPELIALHCRSRPNGRQPYGYGQVTPWGRSDISMAAKRIYKSLKISARAELDEWATHPWQSTYCEAAHYAVGGKCRRQLERVFCWGLGRFDLVVIDEAHKASRDESGLSRLTAHLQVGTAPARLGLTATPVALHVDEWNGTLERVGVPSAIREAAQKAGRDYARATGLLRETWRTSGANRGAWMLAAGEFFAALDPYVIRRSKREDFAVREFCKRAGRNSAYRKIVLEPVIIGQLNSSWRKIVFAAESVSATVHGGEKPVEKRLRLNVGNGLAIGTVIDAALSSDEERMEDGDDIPSTHGNAGETKQEARARFWIEVIRAEVGGAAGANGSELPLYEHPLIEHIVNLIEGKLAEGEKVLVFGRFSRPMKALQALLNARARLRAMVHPNGEPWPEEKVKCREVDRHAAKKMGIDAKIMRQAFANHEERYRKYENQRAWLRENVVRLLKKGLGDSQEIGNLQRSRAIRMIVDAESADAQSKRHEGPLTSLTRAVWESASPRARSEILAKRVTKEMVDSLTAAFVALIEAAEGASDPVDTVDSSKGDDIYVERVWSTLMQLIREEFGRNRGGFARLLVGATRPETRRLLQAAFNRSDSFPRVLIAQSKVGSEGLNLHEACRVVVLFHPEWNPGVVEQQIGRVDRLGSRWERELIDAIRAGVLPGDLPRIEVIMPIFEGTYDEHNWRVLQTRWDDLRAQLHGIVVDPSIAASDEERRLADEINRHAPNFSPTVRRCLDKVTDKCSRLILKNPKWKISVESIVTTIASENLLRLYEAGFFFDLCEARLLATVSDDNSKFDLGDLRDRLKRRDFVFRGNIRAEAGFNLDHESWDYFKRYLRLPKVPVAKLEEDISFAVRAFNAAGARTWCSCGGHSGKAASINFVGRYFFAWACFLVEKFDLPFKKGPNKTLYGLKGAERADFVRAAEQLYSRRIQLRKQRKRLIDQFGKRFVARLNSPDERRALVKEKNDSDESTS